MRTLERLAAFTILLCLANCKGSDEPGGAAPSASPATPGSALPAPETTGTTGIAQGQIPAADAKPTAKPSSIPDAGAPSDAGQPDAAAPTPDAGSSASKMKACTDKCQPVLQSCMTPTFSADGGLPQLKDPAACQKAFDDCRAACTP